MQLCNIQKISKNLVKQKSNIGGLKNRLDNNYNNYNKLAAEMVKRSLKKNKERKWQDQVLSVVSGFSTLYFCNQDYRKTPGSSPSSNH